MLLASVGALGIVRRLAFFGSTYAIRRDLHFRSSLFLRRGVSSSPWSRLDPGMVLTSPRLDKERKAPRSKMIIGSAESFVLEFGCNYWFPRGIRTIGGLTYLTIYQGLPCSSSTVLGVSIQVSEDRDFTDHSDDRFENMPLVLETIPLREGAGI